MCVNLYLGSQFQVDGDQLIDIKARIASTDNEHCGQDEGHLGGKSCASVAENEGIQDSGVICSRIIRLRGLEANDMCMYHAN